MKCDIYLFVALKIREKPLLGDRLVLALCGDRFSLRSLDHEFSGGCELTPIYLKLDTTPDGARCRTAPTLAPLVKIYL
jgi:hypothetical protein